MSHLTPKERAVMALADTGVAPEQISFRLEMKLDRVRKIIKYYGGDSRARDVAALRTGSARLKAAIDQARSAAA